MDESEKKTTPVPVQALVPLALSAVAELFNTSEDRLPAGMEGILDNFGASCFQEGVDAAHEARTVPAPDTETMDTLGPPAGRRDDTQPLESLLPPPGTPSIFSRPTRPPPSGKKKKNRLPPPPRLPRGIESDEEK